ncbi:SMI1/KNR4 family protein [Pseudomonas entomophila]|uniref:SMI1/KNR4 family protein n=1 Tax=Pseudomonas entomophila TaxID=312306 RepID=UPI001BCFDF49|nr:SMI1/KNR4 family protein [Pseudomonas entomophila]QVM93012.1 SMI1/KNR4 family protein [Pseudomonas entomophila]
MIPLEVTKYLSGYKGDIARADQNRAASALQHLGVATDSEFGRFYLKYQGSFISPRPVAELLDIEGPDIPAIPDQTDYVWDRYEIPTNYLALSSDESEGMYLYGINDGAVYDLDISHLDEFINGKLPARWKSFNEFLTWYFEPPA